MKNGRNTAGKFTSGNSGRPKGAKNKKTLAIESLLEGLAARLKCNRVAGTEVKSCLAQYGWKK
mgnify:CR=1 FL=1